MKTQLTLSGSFIAILLTASTAISQISEITELKISNCDNSAISIQSTTVHVTCGGGNDGSIDIEISGGTAGMKYSWLHDPDASLDLQNLSAGTYEIHVSDSNNCILAYSVEVTEPAALEIQAVLTYPEPSTPGSIDISISGGSPSYSYYWSNGAQSQDVNNLTEDDYIVTVTDIYGCFVKETYPLYNSNQTINPNVILYPNPAMEFTTMTLENVQGTPIIRNEQGQVMDTELYTNTKNGSIVIPGLPAGSYWITCYTLTGDTQTLQYKITK